MEATLAIPEGTPIPTIIIQLAPDGKVISQCNAPNPMVVRHLCESAKESLLQLLAQQAAGQDKRIVEPPLGMNGQALRRKGV